jgi:hypothetical protein
MGGSYQQRGTSPEEREKTGDHKGRPYDTEIS